LAFAHALDLALAVAPVVRDVCRPLAWAFRHGRL
jgi:hypothetical protein